MMATPSTLLPANEAARLQSLQSYAIVRSLQEDFFDELVVLLADLFRLPIAYIGLMEADQLSYKATYGFSRQLAQPRASTLCALVIKQNQVVVYYDLAATNPTSLDAFAIQNSLASEVCFYAGAPLRMPDNQVIGTLCVAGQQPRAFSPAEQQLLEAMAEVVSCAIAVRSSYCGDEHGIRWSKIRTHARDEVYALGALVRYLSARYGTSTPVPEEIVLPVARRLHDLRAILQEHE
ncbi:GAF domain-containing protein [Hymenobacter setariae]|uniref:GAF domain-containing protein n=1 Tax=Hymenobacter setariae TaxID=2594794 RepID=A0A558C4M4_9BACT|nr:GAF domain-containing protein [Hymenobacter setariae]TVT43743.1 GAF domain-containing protein [Hymenobacter setariae]